MNQIVELDAVPLSRAIRSRELSCAEAMNAYLDQIERLNPRVNAIVSMRPREDLLAEARDRDAALARGEYAGWMHGFPHAVKDLEATRGIRTTMGSPILRDWIPDADSILVERIRRAGAIIIGKTNIPEFGLGSHSFNPVFGTTVNAWDQTRCAGGSSGGAAVALALRMLPVADGSDHAGSLRNPGAFNNVLGFRTSYGRVPGDWRDSFGASLAVAGPMARKIEDLAMLLSTIAGYDPRLPLSIREDPAGFAAPLQRDFKRTRIAWLGDFGGYLPFEPGVLDLCRAALKTFESIGCVVEEAVPDYPIGRVWEYWLKLRAFQVGSILRTFHADPSRRELMKPEARWEVENGFKLSAYDVAQASTVRSEWYQAVRKFFERFEFFVLPSAQVFPFDASMRWPREISGRAMDTYHRWMEVMIPVTMSGCPALNLPAGFSAQGLPMGIQLVAPNHGEMECLQLGYGYQNAARELFERRPPLLAGS